MEVSFPATVTLPVSLPGATWGMTPFMVWQSVLLPEPLVPISRTNSPFLICRVMFCREGLGASS